jgi:hypothetical protein
LCSYATFLSDATVAAAGRRAATKEGIGQATHFTVRGRPPRAPTNVGHGRRCVARPTPLRSNLGDRHAVAQPAHPGQGLVASPGQVQDLSVRFLYSRAPAARQAMLDAMRVFFVLAALALASCGGNQITPGNADASAGSEADSGARDGPVGESTVPTDGRSTQSDVTETGTGCQTCLVPGGSNCCVKCSNGHVSCGDFGNACPPCS